MYAYVLARRNSKTGKTYVSQARMANDGRDDGRHGDRNRARSPQNEVAEEPRTIEQVVSELGMSRNRVRRLEADGLARLARRREIVALQETA